MRPSREPFVSPAISVLVVSFALLGACDEEGVVPEPEETRTVSGRVLDMPRMTPVPGASVELIGNDVDITDPAYRRSCVCTGDLCSFRTTSDGEGWWRLEDVPLTYDPETSLPYDLLIKIVDGAHPPAYNVFILSMGEQFDLMRMSTLFYRLFALEALGEGANPERMAVVVGAAIGFTDMTYPHSSDALAGVTAGAEGGLPPESIPIIYLSDLGLPDPRREETSSLGAFYMVVPDAGDDAVPVLNIAGSSPERVLMGGYYPACPGSFGVVALIDPYYDAR
jgi:hypothetical protein